MQCVFTQAHVRTYSVTTCIFHSDPTRSYILVGVAKDLTLAPRSFTAGFVYTFLVTEQGTLELVHKTEVEEPPQSLCAFQGRVLLGMGKTVRICDLGKKRLLRKCEWKVRKEVEQSNR